MIYRIQINNNVTDLVDRLKIKYQSIEKDDIYFEKGPTHEGEWKPENGIKASFFWKSFIGSVDGYVKSSEFVVIYDIKAVDLVKSLEYSDLKSKSDEKIKEKAEEIINSEL